MLALHVLSLPAPVMLAFEARAAAITLNPSSIR